MNVFHRGRGSPDFQHLRDLVLQAIALLAILFLFTLRVAHVSGVSMEPTVPENSYVVVSTLDYRFHMPRRGDVIAFWHDRVGPETFIKRVIGTPGDRVAEKSGVLSVNGRAFEPGVARILDRRTVRSALVEPKTYYVVGDNLPRSDDSRNWGAVHASSIMGRVDAVLWPLQDLRVIR